MLAKESTEKNLSADITVIGDINMLASRAKQLKLDVDLVSDTSEEVMQHQLRVMHVATANKVVAGKLDAGNSQYVLDTLTAAINVCRNGHFDALVTAPVHKGIINQAGIPFTGHTELIAAACGVARPVMLLAADELRVALATTHLPLRNVPDALTQDGIRDVVSVLHAELQSRFGIADPEIIVCGLNPHAGEGGHLGDEDEAIIAPVVRELAASGMRVRGPIPADTAFTPAAGSSDGIVAMYHDQGLPVLKYAGFGSAINITLGLPIIRTSVDHGTALDIAGTGHADTGSFFAAIELAIQLASG